MERECMQLNEIKAVAYRTLSVLKEFCQSHGLKYYLSNGTLLGAVKYKGFIPWDDDIDVFMPREDYDRLIAIYADSEQYKLFSRERNSKYKFSFAKLCDMTTSKIETNIDSGVSLGIDIDIFPLDSCSAHILHAGVQKRLAIYQLGCILSKFVSSKGKPLHKRLVIEGCRLLGFDFFCHRLERLVKKEISLGSEYMGCLMWPIYGKREIIPAEVFSDTVEVEFEGEKFPAPIGYDTYLRSLYGTYENDPPLDQQKTHHKYTAYRISPE